jgi:hypothetical protein
MNAHIPSQTRTDSHESTRPTPESVLVAAVLGAFVLALVSTGQLVVAAHVLALVVVWFVAVALLVAVAFGVVHAVASVDL